MMMLDDDADDDDDADADADADDDDAGCRQCGEASYRGTSAGSSKGSQLLHVIHTGR